MNKIDIRFNNHPADSKMYDTTKLRERYLIEKIFEENEITLTYSHHDRIVAGGAFPTTKEVVLGETKELGTSFFLERRELGVINIGGNGYMILDGKKYEMVAKDGMYVATGTKEVVFGSNDEKNPAKFYLNCAPSHHVYPTVHVPFSKANPRTLGDDASMNKRTIYLYLNPSVCQTSSLQMGMTMLSENNCWNTMPAHTHDRRMEVYFYFNMEDDTRVFHMMGEPSETRHIIVENEQAVISPSWSIHSGVGTKNYTFIWGMTGENQSYDDMDHIKMSELK